MNTTSFAKFQKLGRALMLPIAVLPVAGLLLRLGQPDLLNIKWIAQAGDAIFANLALVFAIGVAVGFAKENHGAAGLAGAIGYLILTAVLKSINDNPLRHRGRQSVQSL
jgi:PTS system N-acetylglucosamine-specific IIC component